MGVKYRNFPAAPATLSAAGTEQKVGSGESTFEESCEFITINHASLACYIAGTEAQLSSAADGTPGGRIYIPASTAGLTLPWNYKNVWFLNAVTDETPVLHVTGHST